MKEQPLSFIFIGPSGSGKGTQVGLLRTYLEKKDTYPTLYVETGAQFREFIKGDSFSSKLSNEVYKTGARQPDFLAVWIWASFIVDKIKNDDHIIFDGTPRSMPEAIILDTAVRFYNIKPFVVYLKLSRQSSEKRLLARGRMDDRTEAEIIKRLDWFQTDVMPAVEHFRTSDLYHFVELDGEKTIEEIHKDLVSRIESEYSK